MHSFLLIILSVVIAETSLASDIYFSTKIKENHFVTMTDDLAFLKSFSFDQKADEKTLKVMGVKDLNSDALDEWLRQRVQYVIENMSSQELTQSLKLLNLNYQYSKPTQIPINELPTAKPSGKGITVMSNFGAGIYLYGKKEKILFSLDKSFHELGRKSIAITSPRVGIIKIGPGHFLDRLGWNKENPKSKANTLKRLTTFFHEARHSDGNGTHVIFGHAVCPDDHDLKGYNACDRNLNGPYTVGAQMIRETLKNCDDCTVKEKERMKLSYLDSESRVIKKTKVVDISQNKLLGNLKFDLDLKVAKIHSGLYAKSKVDQLYIEIKELKEKINKLMDKTGSFKEIPSLFLDASPEGQR